MKVARQLNRPCGTCFHCRTNSQHESLGYSRSPLRGCTLAAIHQQVHPPNLSRTRASVPASVKPGWGQPGSDIPAPTLER